MSIPLSQIIRSPYFQGFSYDVSKLNVSDSLTASALKHFAGYSQITHPVKVIPSNQKDGTLTALLMIFLSLIFGFRYRGVGRYYRRH